MRRLFFRLHRDETAQTQMVSLISFIFLLLVMAFPFNIGWNLARKTKLQNAADAAAYSAAVVQADGLSAIAWLNNMESYLYHKEVQAETWFCRYGTEALLEEWGDRNGQSLRNASGPAKDWIDGRKSDISSKFGKSMYPEAFFRDEILKKTAPYIYDESQDKRILESWINSLREVAFAIAQALPDMMRNEAMRMAYRNMGSKEVRMAFFPDGKQLRSGAAPVVLDFTPSDQKVGPTSDTSFMKYADWVTGGSGSEPVNPFVERAIQIADQLGADYIKLHEVYLPGVDFPLSMKPWYKIYQGEPRKRDNNALSRAFGAKDEVYTALGTKAIECWDSDDRNESQHDTKPCGHWHVTHLHPHYWCVSHLSYPDGCSHKIIPWIHSKGHEDNRDCDAPWRKWGCSTGTVKIHAVPTNIIPFSHWGDLFSFPSSPVMPVSGVKAMIRSDFYPFLLYLNGGDDHHVMIACPICWNAFIGEFPKSNATHYLRYSNPELPSGLGNTPMHPTLTDLDDHELGLSDPSQVRAYLEDLLTQTYADWFGFQVSDNYHKIFRSNFCPDTVKNGVKDAQQGDLCPTIIFKPSGKNGQQFFGWGVTVALYVPQRTPLFGGPVMGHLDGMVAVASAKAGIVMEKPAFGGASRLFPDRLITGIGERVRSGDGTGASRYDAAYMKSNFLDAYKKNKKILNLFHTNWGARLIPVDKSAPENHAGRAPVEWVFLTRNLYKWDPGAKRYAKDGGTLADRIPLGKMGGSDWSRFARAVAH